MKVKVLCFVLVASISVFAQGRGSHGGSPMGGGSMGAGSMGGSSTGSMGSTHGSMGESHGAMNGSEMNHQPSTLGKQSPDTILSKNTQLNSNLEKLLPKGMTAQQACSGFKNLGQCVAAIHVSNNLGIPFADLKNKMTGTGSANLGKAIQDLNPNVNAKAESKKAQKQAQNDLQNASS